MLDREGNVSSWNAGAQRFKGYVAEDIIGEHFSRFYTEDDQAAGLPSKALETAEREGRFESEGWRVRKDGQRFWAHVVIDPIRNPAGHLIGFAKITRDLSERKAAEDELRRSQEQFRLLVQGVTDYAIYLLDTTGHIASWNAGAERIKGYSAEEIVGEHFSRFYTPEDAAAGLPGKVLDTALKSGKYESQSLRLRKDGTPFWAHVIVDPIYDDEHQHIGFAKITRDITQLRETEQELAEARDRLVQSQKLESLGQLTGGIAHDFNNLLTAVLGSLETLSSRLPNDVRFMKPLANAIAGAQRGATLTQRLLAFARKQHLKVGAVDVAELIRSMADLMRSSVGSTVGVATKFPPQLHPAHTDPNQLELAILNLVLNARDAMPLGGDVTISVSEAALPKGNAMDLPPGSYIAISVSDTGSGMDEETLKHAIEPFFTTKEVGRGTGLGLPMVHGLAAQSGGRLVIYSQPGRGTTAEVWLPAAMDDNEGRN
jgi:PAS domain S-box-containing protein